MGKKALDVALQPLNQITMIPDAKRRLRRLQNSYSVVMNVHITHYYPTDTLKNAHTGNATCPIRAIREKITGNQKDHIAVCERA